MKKYDAFNEFLLDCCSKYNLELGPLELGFLSSMLYSFINDKNNKDKGVFIAESIKEKVEKIIDEFYK